MSFLAAVTFLIFQNATVYTVIFTKITLMIQISFRQGMLSGFTVIVLLLGGAALNGWLVVERLLVQSRQGSVEGIALTASIQ